VNLLPERRAWFFARSAFVAETRLHRQSGNLVASNTLNDGEYEFDSGHRERACGHCSTDLATFGQTGDAIG